MYFIPRILGTEGGFGEKIILNNTTIKISVEDRVDCPRYVGGLVTNVSIGTSPEWMQDRLIAAGQRPINSLVDISNFVLLEFGHPTHIFDYDKLNNKEILDYKVFYRLLKSHFYNHEMLFYI